MNGHSAAAAAAADDAVEEIERPLGPPGLAKLTSWDLFRSMGSPKFVVAVRVLLVIDTYTG